MRFETHPDCYLDTQTGIEWSLETYGPMSWYDSKDTYPPNTNWILPTVEELFSIIDFNKFEPSTKLPNMKPDFYWSITSFALYADEAWLVGFNFGRVLCYPKLHHHFVRYVRIN